MRISKDPAERKQEIIDTAKELFITRGYEATQIKDIVNQMEVAQGLFYYYFKSKEEVFEAVAEVYVKDLLASIQHVMEYQTAKEQLFGIIDAFANISQNNPEMFEEIHNVRGGLFLKKINHKLRNHLLPQITEIVKYGVETGEFKATEYVEEITAIITYGIFHFLEEYYSDVADKDVERIKTICERTMMRMLGVSNHF